MDPARRRRIVMPFVRAVLRSHARDGGGSLAIEALQRAVRNRMAEQSHAAALFAALPRTMRQWCRLLARGTGVVLWDAGNHRRGPRGDRGVRWRVRDATLLDAAACAARDLGAEHARGAARIAATAALVCTLLRRAAGAGGAALTLDECCAAAADVSTAPPLPRGEIARLVRGAPHLFVFDGPPAYTVRLSGRAAAGM